MSVTLKWITPNAEAMVLDCARVSAPESELTGEPGERDKRLLRYLIRNKHWSPFEMASMCVEITTTRDISRQIIRHRTFSFQEFSQRYASVVQVKPAVRQARLQDTKNRQNSLDTQDETLQSRWQHIQEEVWELSTTRYQEALEAGIAKEQARALLPEGMTQTRLYMSGTLRSWLHYCQLRSGNGTQREHAEIAQAIGRLLHEVVPTISEAALE